jgi:hypothetical protein
MFDVNSASVADTNMLSRIHACLPAFSLVPFPNFSLNKNFAGES